MEKNIHNQHNAELSTDEIPPLVDISAETHRHVTIAPRTARFRPSHSNHSVIFSFWSPVSCSSTGLLALSSPRVMV